MADLEHFDPDQSIDERRQIQRGMRELEKQTTEEQDELLAPDGKVFVEKLKKSDDWIRMTKQTSEAQIDSRFLVRISELAYRRSVKVTAGSAVNGIDVDEFVSKCITYMKHGRGIVNDDHAELSHTQHQRRGRDRGRAAPATMAEDDDDEVGDSGDMLDWAHFGKYAAIPHIRRPALPNHLLGPLSVERKVRKVGKRTAPLRVANLQEVRPEVLDPDAMRGAEKSDLSAMCGRILRQLEERQASAQEAVEQAVNRELPLELREDPDALRPYYSRFGVRDTGGIDLLRFAVNPHSFSQTVENLFYISFLIRDGKIALEFDDDGLPSIATIDQDDAEAVEKGNATRHQAVISLDEASWKDVVKAFSITKSMIPHRDEPVQRPGARGWYN
ncbi:hypothetical protein PgNI_10277 [Pyricularia grisea]|uniref:Non-structural maintenance of chromosomes element 4 n=1 Tax=Pyricularia grisea TaxID=148305 RepID=A0A6P8AZ06_PYRGI|nr:hypothetical protein PgNI_10277 [Pyricularia grisea]TLD07608.1 hypothetical protein PgNI_10277 [Pyricularia grisea]